MKYYRICSKLYAPDSPLVFTELQGRSLISRMKKPASHFLVEVESPSPKEIFDPNYHGLMNVDQLKEELEALQNAY